MKQNMFEIVMNILRSDTLTLEELQRLQQELQKIVLRQSLFDDIPSPSIDQRQKAFVNQVLRYAESQRLPVNTEQLKVAGRYMYYREVLGQSDEEVMQRALTHVNCA